MKKKEKESGYFICTSRTMPDWKVNGKFEFKENVYYLTHLGTLLITNITKKNQGIYECYGSSELRKELGYGKLIVLGKYNMLHIIMCATTLHIQPNPL